jgi:hypothetical protein
MSVWQSLEDLRTYVYRSDTALWWVPAGHRPSIDEAKKRPCPASSSA